MRKQSSIKNNIILTLLTLLFLFFAAEITVRINDSLKGYNFFSNDHRDKISARMWIRPYRIFGLNDLYQEKNGVQYIVSRYKELYPFIKSKDTHRIVFLGGSTTEDEFTYQKDSVHYPIVLQRLLQDKYPSKKIEVINLGNQAYATTHMLTLLVFDVISWNPDLVVVCENNNDRTYPWPGFQFDYSNKYATPYYTDNLFNKNYTTINALFRWSSFYWFIKEKWDNIFNKPQIYAMRTKTYGNEPPQRDQDIFHRNLLNFFFIANHWDISVLYASQALNPNEKTSDYIEVKEDYVRPLDSEQILHHKIYNRIIKQVAESTQSYFVDNDSSLAGDPMYFIDAIHYNLAGTKKIAKTYFDFIVSNNLIK